MADTSTEPDTTTSTSTEPDTSTTAADDAQLGDAGKRALAAERRAARDAARERDALAAELQQFKDRDKSEGQKLLERAEAAEKRAAEVEARALRLEVAAEKGLSPAQAKRLVGETREELEADAAELLTTFKPATQEVADQLDLTTRSTGTPTTTSGPAADFAKALAGIRS